jgi:RNA recognition motif-containing protein
VNPNQKDRLFVGGLNESIDEQALRDHFAQFGTVKDCYIPKANGRPRGYGYVTQFPRI